MNKPSLSPHTNFGSQDIVIATIWLAVYLVIAFSAAVTLPNQPTATANAIAPQTQGNASSAKLPRPMWAAKLHACRKALPARDLLTRCAAKTKRIGFSCPFYQLPHQPKEDVMRVIAIAAVLGSLFLGGMALLTPLDAGSRPIQASPGVDVSALENATDAKSLTETEIHDPF
jgi:hypothetical protein